nr:MAG TPA: NADH-PPase NADH pyrophosphatase zinc ribbon domain [Caudoviricetes sp.]
MKGIVITTKNEMRVQEFPEPAHRSIGDAVGGWIEIVHPMRLGQPYCMIVNEISIHPPREGWDHYCPNCGAKMDIKDGGDNDAAD